MHDVDFETLSWLNPPRTAMRDGATLTVTTRNATDFWHDTFYGFRRHSGHFLHKTVRGDFTASVKFIGRFEALYDQAGLMIRSDDTHWVKAGIEYTDGARFLSSVVTNGFSDWSVFPFQAPSQEVSIRLTRHAEAIRVQVEDPIDGKWHMTRLGYLAPTEEIEVGVMCCSPEREGFEVTFKDFRIAPAIDRRLHEAE
jgi:regulation of enolase protein 1 (concanavalin A-like superfamily)